jgi:hypothetical protein
MFQNILRRNLRQPLMGLAVLLFAAVLTVVLCYLHKSSQEELRSYEETYASVPVFFKVVDLDGSKPKVSKGIDGLAVELFQKDWMVPDLKSYIAQTHVRVSIEGKHYVIESYGDPELDKMALTKKLPQITVGISSTWVAEELTEGWGGKIYWKEGYDESILLTNEFVCIVPESMKYMETFDAEYTYSYWPNGIVGDIGGPITKKTRHTFQVVGYYTDPGNQMIYCPYETLSIIHAQIGKPKKIEEIGAILTDNNLLPQLREDASQWFATPNALGEKTPWGRYGFEHFLFALDIDDSMLVNLETNMKNSLRLNQLASAVVFALSAGAGFLTGFLVIRSRKREIALMRTLGTSNPVVCLEFGAEQIMLVLLGVLLGGSYTHWEPLNRLGLFAGIYLAGLTAALLIFIRTNLLATMKEDE